jgi:hypothetical protein
MTSTCIFKKKMLGAFLFHERRKMNVFEEVKRTITARQAAERYGIKVYKHGMAICPFHNDKNPSMKVDKRYHCFACQADGDVIDLIAGLYNLSPKEATLKLAEDFGIPFSIRVPSSPQWQSRKNTKYTTQTIVMPYEQTILKATIPCFHLLATYLYVLKYWQEHFAPKTRDEEWDFRFVEALQRKNHVEYLLDTLLWGTETEKILLLTDIGKEVNKYAQRIKEYRKTVP